MAKIIAKTIKGKEFIYSKTSAHNVSNASALKIRDALNSIKWQLKDDEIWHIYDVDWYTESFTYKKFTLRNGVLKEV